MSWLRRSLLSTFYWPVRLLVRAKSIPQDVESELGIDRNKPIIYLLQTDSVTDQLALSFACKQRGLPSPIDDIQQAGATLPSSVFLRRPQPVFKRQPKQTEILNVFTEMFHLHREHPQLDLQVVPVFVTWGRAPGKGSPGWADLIADKASPSWLRKFFIVLFLGRDNFVSFSKAVSTRSMANKQQGDDHLIAQKLVRVANTHFHRKRQSMTGPTLLERSELNNAVLGAESVKSAVQEEARSKNLSMDEARQRAQTYIDEIAGDYREGLIRIGDRVLTRIWNKIYNGISVSHAKRIRELAQNGHEIIYVPCHRSHMDYLLLTYVIYHEGMVTPHIAAGINLNFWPVGKIFRRAGAFFLRRSFAGNKLYTAVFREYLELLFNKGYSVKYYPEGGRSRTGRLIPPKTGMLAMTLQAMLKGIKRPVSIVPVYIGYEHVMEVNSYLKELSGSGKKKESPMQILSAVRKLKNYGHGYVNFGEPLQLNQFLDDNVPNWRESQAIGPDKKPSWLTPAVNQLANTVMVRINKAAAINGMALTSLCLLSSKTKTMTEAELIGAMENYLNLLKVCPYSADATMADGSAANLLDSILKLKRLKVSNDSLGKLISPMPNKAVIMTYYRNNILHLFALPGLIMTIVFAHRSVERSAVLNLVGELYPFLQRELFIYMSKENALAYCERLIDQLCEQKLLLAEKHLLTPPSADSQAFHAGWLLSRAMQETVQRYAVVLRVLELAQTINRGELEKQSRQMAEHLSTLYGMSSPEFYDKNVFAALVTTLREQSLVESTDEGTLRHSDNSRALQHQINQLVWPEITQHLAQLKSL
ncbi:glycerol-3-phosphate 1-O-acyltransferase PlsB [Alteromonas oceanisediminis]|uniref:glycerol-3-phosphate 1-O-acyltransferase PlsB n=1 Tax=Alteromonas oceanisediminis TaxID=2836180 RepID=UPI001BDAEA18|nr:glycerol-3-phosphate 1-O-acyltransferase PlsB [Alteromonas oceanisediminis]MBT0586204.1 glycerol-3-phosphate 1-O-acyltransferase PlsB [Alteromonas oceanisediminis]